ncbi:unnamed protein product [Sphagnum jensenii]|uniref:Auxin-responsive protein n=1 Tax=Sphagnum jensenii TaxID=128206 RepID=A0ABP1A7R4_9BRYO
MMAVCGASSVFSQSSFQYECMELCPGASPGGLQTSLLCWGITRLESEASSCLSATMGNTTDTEDSGASQPPDWNTRGGQQMEATQASQLEHLKTTVPSSIDAQELGGVSQGRVDICDRGNEVQDASTLQLASIMKEEASECTSEVQVKQEDFTGASNEGGIISPPRKRLRVESPSGSTLQGRLMSQEVEVSPHQHSSPKTSNVGARHDISGRLKESAPSSSSHSGEQASKGGQHLWWLMPRSSPVQQFPEQSQLMLKNIQDRDGMGDLSFEGRGQRSTSKENEYLFKSPTYNPYMLNALDSKQGITGSHTIYSSRLTAEPNSSEHPFLSLQDSTSARLGSSNMVANVEDPSRAANLFFDKGVAGGPKPSNNSAQEADDALGVNDSGHLERCLSIPEAAQHTGLENTSGETKGTSGLHLPIGNLHGNANTNFYAWIRGAMPLKLGATQVFPSGEFSHAGGLLPNFTQDPLSFGLATAGLSSIGHPPAGQATQLLERNMQQVSKEMTANSLQANALSSFAIPTFRSSVQTTDGLHVNGPDLSSLEFLQRSADHYSRHALPQGLGNTVSNFQFSSVPSTLPYGFLPTELNLSLPVQGSQETVRSHSAPSWQEFRIPTQGSYCPVNQAQRPEDGFGRHTGDLAGNHELPRSLQLDLSFPARAVSPSVTAVMEGRSIGQRVCLNDYNSYEIFSQAMRKTFQDCIPEEDLVMTGQEIHLGNAIPGYVIAYEDDEGDLLLAGDLVWREFVRAAKRIWIVSAVKSSCPNVPKASSSPTLMKRNQAMWLW